MLLLFLAEEKLKPKQFNSHLCAAKYMWITMGNQYPCLPIRIRLKPKGCFAIQD